MSYFFMIPVYVTPNIYIRSSNIHIYIYHAHDDYANKLSIHSIETELKYDKTNDKSMKCFGKQTIHQELEEKKVFLYSKQVA